MKILLFGENSSLHSNLKDGLLELGHQVTIASNGDGWKNIPRDIDLNYEKKIIPRILASRLYPWIDLKRFTGYDVVQIISPDSFYRKYFPGMFLYKLIRKYNKKVFLLGAGSDSYFWKYGRERLKYGPFEDTLKYDLKSSKHPSEAYEYTKLNEYIAETVDGIIPVTYEYELSYRGHKNLLRTIPMPINTKKILYKKNNPKNKLVIFHGLNRYGFKGTRHIEDAFNILSNKYPNDLELVIEGHMPLKEYLNVIKRTNISIDQTNTYSLGLSGLYSMAMGKVTLGGCEPESLEALNIKKSPCFNIKPNKESIINTIELILEQKEKIEDIGLESRNFVEEFHDHIKIAKQYLNIWD